MIIIVVPFLDSWDHKLGVRKLVAAFPCAADVGFIKYIFDWLGLLLIPLSPSEEPGGSSRVGVVMDVDALKYDGMSSSPTKFYIGYPPFMLLLFRLLEA